ncbi:MAG: zf-HC2 domain-containing protein [Bryobacteraceae bacterium]|nr:zf-HC2 domain-containing protein [Bryobacteraceae bacterium]MDW8377623.1 zf-HC2 domain-containing protein [Bryobacterales bacterium]
MSDTPHASDQELLLALDGELDAHQAQLIEQHLLHCAACRARRDQLQQALVEFLELHRRKAPAIPPAEAASARLKAALAELTSQPRAKRWGLVARSLLAAGIFGALLLLAALLESRRPPGPLPDPRLTPGAARILPRQQVCSMVKPPGARAVSQALADQVFRQYGIGKPRPGAYELDYLISPELGGLDDIQNLWPQPYSEGEWNSRVKDALEEHLRRLVCDGRLELATAQREIAKDWIAAYRKYFGSLRPIAEHAFFVKDLPWD